MLFAVPDKVGALNTALNMFARNRINISKIESRPLRSRPWEYLFFVDLKAIARTRGSSARSPRWRRKAFF